MLRRFLLITALGLAFCACKDDLIKPPAQGDSTDDGFFPGSVGSTGSNRDGGVATNDGGSGDAGTCTDVVYGGALSDEEAVADDAPPGEGGTIADGTYNLTSTRRYVGAALPGPTGDAYRATLVLRNGAFERVSTLASTGVSQETRARGVYSVSGTSIVFSASCPAASQETFTYTATTTTLLLTNITTKRTSTYTLGP